MPNTISGAVRAASTGLALAAATATEADAVPATVIIATVNHASLAVQA